MGRIIQHFYGTPKATTNKGKLSNLLYPRIMKWDKTATWFQQQHLGPSGITENLSFCLVTTKQYLTYCSLQLQLTSKRWALHLPLNQTESHYPIQLTSLFYLHNKAQQPPPCPNLAVLELLTMPNNVKPVATIPIIKSHPITILKTLLVVSSYITNFIMHILIFKKSSFKMCLIDCSSRAIFFLAFL